MNSKKIKSVLVGILGVIAIFMLVFLLYRMYLHILPQILFVTWRLWFNWQTYIRGIFYNKRISWSRVGGVVFAILIFEAVLTLIMWWGGFYS